MKKKIALIFGVTGQDGSYLANFLLKKKYIVHGIKRRSSSPNTFRVDDIYKDPHDPKVDFFLHYGDLTDSLSVLNIIKIIKPDEIYNLGAQSHVGVSFLSPEYTANVNALGTLRILDSIKTLGLQKKTKFYQAGTSEMFGSSKPPQTEKTNFCPRSPYGAAKLYAHWVTCNYRDAYGIFACNGILFNHESPLRGETFITQKIVQALCKIYLNMKETLYLGNLYAKRDWGHAKDYVEAMWLMLQRNSPEDFVIATGKQCTVKNFIKLVCNYLNLKLIWKGSGLKEVGFINKKPLIKIEKKYFRPTEVESLLGLPKKARKKLKWKSKYNLKLLIADMVDSSLKKLNDK